MGAPIRSSSNLLQQKPINKSALEAMGTPILEFNSLRVTVDN